MVVSVEISEDLTNTLIRGSENMSDIFKIWKLVKAAVISESEPEDDGLER